MKSRETRSPCLDEMDPVAEATIVQLLPLLADEAVYTASLSRLARVAQLGSKLASQRQQLAAGVTQMLERCSEEYVFIKETAQHGVESELLRTNSTAQKNRYAPKATERPKSRTPLLRLVFNIEFGSADFLCCAGSPSLSVEAFALLI